MTPIQILNQHFQGKSIHGYTPMIDGEVLTGENSMTIFKSNIISGIEYRVKRYTIKRVEMPTWKDLREQEYTEPFWLVLDNGKRFPIRMDCKLETL